MNIFNAKYTKYRLFPLLVNQVELKLLLFQFIKKLKSVEVYRVKTNTFTNQDEISQKEGLLLNWRYCKYFCCMKNRDNFSKPTIEILAKRAGYLCSNPDCRKATIGSHEDESKSTSIGEAAHITAASPGGPRFDATLTSEERNHSNNGIWLCSVCATLIDKDHEKFPTGLLQGWKRDVNEESANKLRNKIKQKAAYAIKTHTDCFPLLEADLLGLGRGRSPRGLSNKNPIEIHDGQPVYVASNHPIFHWEMSWRYTLAIYNNSSYNAYNLKIESIGNIHFTEFELLKTINNLAPLSNIELKVKYVEMVEGTGYAADEIMKSRCPKVFDQLLLKLTYLDDKRKVHYSIISFDETGLINRKD